jgi:hypothetical protein
MPPLLLNCAQRRGASDQCTVRQSGQVHAYGQARTPFVNSHDVGSPLHIQYIRNVSQAHPVFQNLS